jgi:hypothetical protein
MNIPAYLICREAVFGTPGNRWIFMAVMMPTDFEVETQNIENIMYDGTKKRA